MHPKFDPIAVIIAPRSSSLERLGQSAIWTVFVSGEWQFAFAGSWQRGASKYTAQFGLVNKTNTVCDGYSIEVDRDRAQVYVCPAGLGQVRCFIGHYGDVLCLSSQPLPYKSHEEFIYKGAYCDLAFSHGVDWGDPIGGGIRLRHGEEFFWHDGRIKTTYAVTHYPHLQSKKQIHSRSEARAHLKGSLTGAVARAMDGHRRVALHISGGIDSTAVAACACKVDGAELALFSWQVGIEASNESRFAREVAQKLGLELHLVRPERDTDAYNPDTFDDCIEPEDITYNPFRFLVGAVLQRSRELGFSYALNGNAGDNVVALPARYAMVEAWQNRQYNEWFKMFRRLVRIVGLRNVMRIREFASWGRYITGRTLVDFPFGSDDERMQSLKQGTLQWPPDLDRQLPKHAAYWKLTSADGLFPVASALTYAARKGCFSHTPYFDYEFILAMQAIPGYFFGYPYEFKRLSRDAFNEMVPASICDRPYRSGNLNPVMDGGFRKNRARLRQYLLDHRNQIPEWLWWPELERILTESDNAVRGNDLFFLHNAIVRVVQWQRRSIGLEEWKLWQQ